MISLPFFLVLSALAAVQATLKTDIAALGVTAVYPGDSGYAAATQAYNLRFTYKPAAVVFPTTSALVGQVVAAARKNNLTVSARSGGHSYVANGLGGKDNVVVVDLSKLKTILVNPTSHVATIETGNRLGDVAVALNNAGRGIGHGTCPYVGVGGHAGHGGFGFTSRKWGLALDAILSMKVVLANGTLVVAARDFNPDLFWAMRGAASSMGIITSINVTTFPVPTFAKIFQYEYNLDYNTAAAAMVSFQTFAQSNIPPELGAEINLGQGSKTGTVYFSFSGGWYGAQSLMNSTLAPFVNKLPKPTKVTFSGDGTYISSVSVLGGGLSTTAPDETDTFYAKSLMTPSSAPPTLAAWTAFMKYLATDGFSSTLNWFMQVELYGGTNSAIRAVAEDDCAYAHRDTMFTFQIYASSSTFKPPFPSNGFTFIEAAANAITSNMPSTWNYGAYLNYIDDKLTNYQNLYYGTHYARLRSIKKAVDPLNVFMFPTSVEEP
ncbi:glucooligosaccharide oxidase [Mycena floridula]|nr:glucooligosaccharide oxidase [Mycena floridula]